MRLSVILSLLLASSLMFADIVSDVRGALTNQGLSVAESLLSSYRSQHGVDPAYVEALSWTARACLQMHQLDQAQVFASQTERLSHDLLQHRALDSDPHLPIALGAALEVEAQVQASRGQKTQAIALLRRSLATYGNTSIRARLQKNLNSLALTGEPAPPLSATSYLGVRPFLLSQAKGSPILLFFWAHWCGDCKYEGPIISRLSSEFSAQGLKIEAPTQLYGYAAQGEDAKPKDELTYIGQVWQRYYPGLQAVPVPVNKANFNEYGASTTPTLVLIDRKGRVTLFHPGLMQYDELRSAIQAVM